MRILPMICALASGAFMASRAANAAVDIRVDLSTQTMHVTDHDQTYDWPVSTARTGYLTPRGVYHPVSLQAMHYSRKYDMSPMPHSIFFKGGYAIHGTYETASLGRPASHGGVRLSAAHAAILFKLVETDGARIAIFGAPRTNVLAERAVRPPAARMRSNAPAPYVYAPTGPTSYYGSYQVYDSGPW